MAPVAAVGVGGAYVAALSKTYSHTANISAKQIFGMKYFQTCRPIDVEGIQKDTEFKFTKIDFADWKNRNGMYR